MASKIVPLQGIRKVMTNLKKEVRKMRNRGRRALITAAIHVRKDMEKTPPLTPRKTGAMRSSFYYSKPRGRVVSVLFLGYTVKYAPWVHRGYTSGPIKNWTRKGSGAFWFEKALKRGAKGPLQFEIARRTRV